MSSTMEDRTCQPTFQREDRKQPTLQVVDVVPPHRTIRSISPGLEPTRKWYKCRFARSWKTGDEHTRVPRQVSATPLSPFMVRKYCVFFVGALTSLSTFVALSFNLDCCSSKSALLWTPDEDDTTFVLSSFLSFSGAGRLGGGGRFLGPNPSLKAQVPIDFFLHSPSINLRLLLSL